MKLVAAILILSAFPVSAPVFATEQAWRSVPAIDPLRLEGLTLYLRADYGVKGVTIAQGARRLSRWDDRSPSRLVFAPDPSSGERLPALENDAVLFDGSEPGFLSQPVSIHKLMGQEEVSFFAVLKQDPRHIENELLGWGTCGEERFNTQFAAQGTLFFFMGNVKESRLSPECPKDWTSRRHVISVVRNGKEARLSVDGDVLEAAHGFTATIKLFDREPFSIAGLCHAGFAGELSAVAIFDHALTPAQEKGVIKNLARHYRVPL